MGIESHLLQSDFASYISCSFSLAQVQIFTEGNIKLSVCVAGYPHGVENSSRTRNMINMLMIEVAASEKNRYEMKMLFYYKEIPAE